MSRPTVLSWCAIPNNPDGRRIDPDTLVRAADTIAARGGVLIVDEAFADIDPGVSVVPAAGRAGLIVLRSLGKMYGLAGARVGFAVADSETIDRFAAALGPWAVAGPALRVATAALSDDAWLEAARRRLVGDRKRLDSLLTATGYSVLGGTDLYRLIRSPKADTLFRCLAADGIWVRRFEDRPDQLRFGMPGCEADWLRLETSVRTHCSMSGAAE